MARDQSNDAVLDHRRVDGGGGCDCWHYRCWPQLTTFTWRRHPRFVGDLFCCHSGLPRPVVSFALLLGSRILQYSFATILLVQNGSAKRTPNHKLLAKKQKLPYLARLAELVRQLTDSNNSRAKRQFCYWLTQFAPWDKRTRTLGLQWDGESVSPLSEPKALRVGGRKGESIIKVNGIYISRRKRRFRI